jgi:hypothetical protein
MIVVDDAAAAIVPLVLSTTLLIQLVPYNVQQTPVFKQDIR